MGSTDNYSITPTSPHSAVLKSTSFSYSLYRIFRSVKFDPASIADLTEFKALMRRAAEIGKSAVDLKELLPTEQAAFEATIPVLMSCYAQEVLNDIMHKEIPAVIAGAGLTSGTDFLYTIDDYHQIAREFDDMNIASIPGLEDLVAEMVGGCLTLEDPDDLRKFPGIKLYMFTPCKTITNMRTHLATLTANAHLFKSYCDKMGISTVPWNSSKIRAKRGDAIRSYQWSSINYQFWAYNLWNWYKNATGDQYIFQARHDQAIALFTAANWLTYFQYIYAQGSSPNSWNNIIRFFYPYHDGNNLLGCCEKNNVQTVAAIDDAIANSDSIMISAAINSSELDWVTSTHLVYILAKTPGIIGDNSTLGLNKEIDTAPSNAALRGMDFLPPEFKIKDFGATTSIWDATNYNMETIFMQKVFGIGLNTRTKGAAGKVKDKEIDITGANKFR